MLNSNFKSFSNKLLNWYNDHHRDLPWRKTKDPYKIWLSEIILQQTRVDQGLPYYLKFIKKYPTVDRLAKANEEAVLRLWQGLGYYSRARNMHHSAKVVTHKYDGQFPTTYNDILQLKGIGQYTAAAIASIAFNELHAVVDGNVIRFLSRHNALEIAMDSTKGKQEIQRLADKLIDPSEPGNFNQAMMEFGATVCTAAQPHCRVCIFKRSCKAFSNDTVNKFPIKRKQKSHKMRFFNYLVIHYNSKIYISRRDDKDIWKGLFEYPVIESNKLLPISRLMKAGKWKQLEKANTFKVRGVSNTFKQVLSHQKIHARFWQLDTDKPLDTKEFKLKMIAKSSIKRYPLPKILTCYLDEKSIILHQ